MGHPCPVCGYLTMPDGPPGSYEICPVCFWEDDPVQFDDPAFRRGANEESLNEARASFARIGAISERWTGHVRPPNEDELPA